MADGVEVAGQRRCSVKMAGGAYELVLSPTVTAAFGNIDFFFFFRLPNCFFFFFFLAKGPKISHSDSANWGFRSGVPVWWSDDISNIPSLLSGLRDGAPEGCLTWPEMAFFFRPLPQCEVRNSWDTPGCLQGQTPRMPLKGDALWKRHTGLWSSSLDPVDFGWRGGTCFDTSDKGSQQEAVP